MSKKAKVDEGAAMEGAANELQQLQNKVEEIEEQFDQKVIPSCYELAKRASSSPLVPFGTRRMVGTHF